MYVLHFGFLHIKYTSKDFRLKLSTIPNNFPEIDQNCESVRDDCRESNNINSIPTGTPLSKVKTPSVNCPAVAAIIRFAASIGPPTRPAFLAIIHDANIPNANT